MGQKSKFSVLLLSLCLLLMAPTASAHEQETLNIILVEDNVRPGNVTDPTFVESNGLVFRMRDNTENVSMRVLIDLNLDGLFNGTLDNVSSWLTRSCELDGNGSLVNDSCAVSHEYVFNSTSRGVYIYQIQRALNGTVIETWNYSVTVHPDIHEEPGVPTVGDCFGAGCEDEQVVQTENGFEITTEGALKITMIVAAIGCFMLLLSIRKERQDVFGDGEDQIQKITQDE